MAKRRRAGQAAAGAFSGASQIISQLMAQRRAEEVQQRVFQQQREMEDLRTANDRAQAEEAEKRSATTAATAATASQQSSLVNTLTGRPEAAARAKAGGFSKIGGVDIGPFLPSQADASKPIFESMRGSTPLQTPTAVAAEFRNAPGGVDDPRFQGPFPRVKVPGSAGRPDLDLGEVVAFPKETQAGPSPRTTIEDLLRTQQSQQTAKREQGLADIATAERAKSRLGPGNAPGFLGAEGFVPTGLTTAQEVSKAGQTAGASAGASRRAELAPDITALEIDKAAKMKAAGMGDIGTDQDQQLGAMMPGLIADHQKAAELEQKGARLKPGVMTALESPALLSSIQKTPMGYSEDSLSYASAANNFTNSRAWQLSGVTVRIDERPNFLSANFAGSGDPPPLVTEKQVRRQTLLSAMTLAAGKGKLEAGRALGRELVAGRIKPDILGQLDFPPDFLKGILEVYKIPVGR